MVLQERDRVLSFGRATQPSQCFQDGHVGFTRTIVLNALPYRYPNPRMEALGAGLSRWGRWGTRASCPVPQFLQESIDERGLPDPCLAGDEDELAFTTDRLL